MLIQILTWPMRGQAAPQPLVRGRVERHGHVEIVNPSGGRLDQLRSRQESQLFEGAVLIPNRDFLAQLLQGKGEGRNAADGVIHRAACGS